MKKNNPDSKSSKLLMVSVLMVGNSKYAISRYRHFEGYAVTEPLIIARYEKYGNVKTRQVFFNLKRRKKHEIMTKIVDLLNPANYEVHMHDRCTLLFVCSNGFC